MTRIVCIVGARPNFMKMGPILQALKARKIEAILVHTGQHYDARMNDNVFADLALPNPDINLEVGSGSHAVQTAEVMKRIEPVLLEQKPDALLVVGDVNSTLACALVAVKMGIKVIHVEAGLRSGDRAMPEEINRILTDQISDFLFTTERVGDANLIAEGIPSDRIFFTGNVMIDSLRNSLARAVPPEKVTGKPLKKGGYGVLTLHRPSNVDNPQVLSGLLSALEKISTKLPLVFPVHPRTRKQIESGGLGGFLTAPGVIALEPAGYLEMLGLMNSARVVLTDSGGMQEETTALGIPCLTLRENTERPITIDEGTNILVGSKPQAILDAFADIEKTGGKAGRIPEYWDGQAAGRIAAILAERLTS